jgi:hypothetical protein
MQSLRDTEAILKAELDAATKHYELAKAEFWRVSVDIPSGIPYPDGPQRIRNAAVAQTNACKVLVTSLRRMNAFLDRGEIPEDLTVSKTR